MDLTVLLYKNGYPPEWDEEVFEKVLEQAENFRKYSGKLVSEKATIYQIPQDSNLFMVAESSTAYGEKND